MGPSDERLSEMLSAVDPVIDVSDSTIDEMSPLEHLEARLESETQQYELRPRELPRVTRPLALTLAIVIAGAGYPFAFFRSSTSSHVTFTSVGRTLPARTSLPNHHLSFANGVAELLYSPVQLGNNIAASRGVCATSDIRGELDGVFDTGNGTWSAVVRLSNAGPPCVLAATSASVQALTSDGHSIGVLTPQSQFVTGVIKLSRGQAAWFIIATLNTSLFPQNSDPNACRPRPAHGIELVGSAPGWPTIRFTVSHQYEVCTGPVSTIVVGPLVPQR
jgi:hypothetical protein